MFLKVRASVPWLLWRMANRLKKKTKCNKHVFISYWSLNPCRELLPHTNIHIALPVDGFPWQCVPCEINGSRLKVVVCLMLNRIRYCFVILFVIDCYKFQPNGISLNEAWFLKAYRHNGYHWVKKIAFDFSYGEIVSAIPNTFIQLRSHATKGWFQMKAKYASRR